MTEDNTGRDYGDENDHPVAIRKDLLRQVNLLADSIKAKILLGKPAPSQSEIKPGLDLL